MLLDIIKTSTANVEVSLSQWMESDSKAVMKVNDTYEDGIFYTCNGVVHPKKGYVFTTHASITMNGEVFYLIDELTKDTIGFYCFFNIAGAAELAAFRDVSTAAWYNDAVNYVFANKLMVGTSDTTFEPNTPLTRAMIVPILYRHAGEPDVSSLNNPFNDVPEGQWFSDAVIWASANRVVNGYGDGKFGSNDPVTRSHPFSTGG